MQGIEIPIGAPLGQLDKDLKDANGKLKSFAAEASKSAGVLGGSVVKGSNQAAFALTNLGRVAQDAPFGFIGIQNNLNPLLESFQRLKAETGTTSGAFKALGKSLIGPAGLGIALSVAGAAILFYQQYQQRANKEVATAKKVTDEYINSLGQVQQAQLKGAQNAQSELTSLKLLYNQYQNANLPLEQRKDAYKEIQKQYPAYFGNMAFESTATDKTKNAYNSLTDSILASARARAAADIITKNTTRQLENEQKVIDLTNQIQAERTKQIKLQTTVDSQNLLAKQEANILTSKQAEIVNKYLKAGAKEAELTKLKNNLLTDSNILTEKNIQLEKSVNAEIAKGGKISGDVGGKGAGSKAQKDVKTVSDVLAQLDIDLKKVSNSVDITFGQGNKDKVKAFATAIDSLTEIKAGGGIIKSIQNDLLNTKNVEASARTLGVTTVTAFSGGFAAAAATIQGVTFKPKFDLLNKELVDFNKSASDIIQNSITDTFGKLGTSIGEALVNGSNVLRAVGNTILQGLASFLSDMGSALIKYGTLAVLKGKLDIAILTGGPVAIAAGLAAIGAGVALKAAGGAIGAAANKNRNTDNRTVATPQSSATISTSAAGSAQDFGGGRVVFEISGTNLIGVLNRAGAKLTRFG
jgi:hypothetical protein